MSLGCLINAPATCDVLYFRGGTSLTIVCAATLQTVQIKLAVSPSHTVLTPTHLLQYQHRPFCLSVAARQTVAGIVKQPRNNSNSTAAATRSLWEKRE